MPSVEENVLIQSGDCSITILPSLGGKIASLRVGPHELLQTPLKPYAPRTRNMGFHEADASGWDECLPSVAACTFHTAAGPATIPDHGDLWRIPWQVLNSNPDSITLRANCFSLPLQLTRSLILTPTPTGWLLQLLYSLTNLGGYTVPWSWAAHPLFAVDPGDRIQLPESVTTLRLEGSTNENLGVAGDAVSWPISSSARSTTDLSLAQRPSSGAGHKLFAGPFTQASHAWATLHRPQAGLRLTVRFEPELTPYLGLWLCYGGWPDDPTPGQPGPKQVCVALEPTTAPVDSLAVRGPWSRSLDPGETVTWPMELAIDQQAQIPLKSKPAPEDEP